MGAHGTSFALETESSLFASGDSKTAGKLVRCCDMALRLNPIFLDPLPYHVIMLEEVRRRAEEFDVLHFHIDQFHFPLFRPIANKTVTTLHGRQDLPAPGLSRRDVTGTVRNGKLSRTDL